MHYSLRYLLYEINQILDARKKVSIKPPISVARQMTSIRILDDAEAANPDTLYFDLGLTEQSYALEGCIVVTSPSRRHLFESCAVALVDTDDPICPEACNSENSSSQDRFDIELIRVFNELSSRMQTLSQLVEESYEIMAEDANLQRLIEHISLFEESPMWICDSSQKMLAYYDPGSYRETSPMWNRLIKYGYHTYTLMDKLEMTGELKAMQQMGDARYMEAGNFPNRYISRTIYRDGKYFGNFYIIQFSRLLTERDLEIANLIGSVLENSQFTQQYVHFDGVNGIRFVEDLIEGKPVERKFILEQLELLGWTMRSEYVVFCINATNLSDSLRRQLVALLRADGLDHCLNHLNEVIVLINSKETSMAQSEKRIGGHLRHFHLQAGISERFYDFESVKPYYEQAAYCAKLSLDGRAVFARYEDHFFEHLHSIASASLADFAPLTTLDEYDRQYAGYLKLTLHTWLRLNANTSLTAKEMHVHRNTIITRMEKVKSLINVDLDSFEIRMRLLYALEDVKDDGAPTD